MLVFRFDGGKSGDELTLPLEMRRSISMLVRGLEY